MTHETIAMKLDQLAALNQSLADIKATEQAAIDAIIAKVQSELDDVEDEFAPARIDAHDAIAALESEVKAAVLDHGETVRGNALTAVYTRGRESWDTKKLDGYATAHPEILAFRKIGEPSVSIRAGCKQ